MANPKKAPAAARKPASIGKILALRVTARRDSFRRIGRKFGAEPVDIELEALNTAEVEALMNDKQLVVQEIEIDAAPDAADPE